MMYVVLLAVICESLHKWLVIAEEVEDSLKGVSKTYGGSRFFAASEKQLNVSRTGQKLKAEERSRRCKGSNRFVERSAAMK